MKHEVIREDVEAMAKALCRAYEEGAADHCKDRPNTVGIMVDTQWLKWVPAAKVFIDKTYGNLLESCQHAYRKHVLEDVNIGWESLGDQLANALVGTMGDDGYNKWLESVEHK